MRLLLFSLFFSLTLISPICVHAQTISPKLEQEIQRKAQATIGTFEILMNVLADETTLDVDKLRAISNSYDASSVHRIFWDEKVIIEDDYSDPSLVDYTNAVDRTVETYLSNLDAFYTLSPLPSIVFSNIKTGKLKIDNNVMVRVYFESQFKNPHHKNKTPYQKTQRVATIRAQKVGVSWLTFIAGVSFFQPADSAEFFPRSAPVKKEDPVVVQTPPRQDTVVVPPVVEKKPQPAPPAAKYTIATQPAYKRGRTYTFDWKGGQPSDQVQVDLYKGDEKQAQVFSGNNKGNTEFLIPKIKPGSNYTIKITDSSSASIISSAPFKIKRRTPWIIKPLIVVGVVGAGVITYKLICPDGCGPERENDLPNPKLPGE